MKKSTFKALALIIIIIITAVSFGIAQNDQSKILIGPNILVSKDGTFNHAEYMFSANPKNPDNLLGVAYVGSPTNHRIIKAYFTRNGGNDWEDVSFPDVEEAGDPQSAFDNKGTAYVLIYGEEKNPGRGGLLLYSSTDEGKTWDNSLSESLTRKIPYDRPQLVIDKSKSKFEGRIYIIFLSDPIENKYTLRLVRSDDGGKTFKEPQVIVKGNEGMGLNGTNVLISSKGTIFYPYVEWFNDKSLPNYFEGRDLHIVSSKDGGVSFSSPNKVARQHSMSEVFPQLAIDNMSVKYRDRIYCVFSTKQDNQSKLMFTYSKDEGKTWSTVKLVDPNSASETRQQQASIAVNSTGVVGVRWLDSRGVEGKGINEYFTASLDGGETFLTPVRVSSKTSYSFPEIANTFWSRSANKDSLIITFDNYFDRLDASGDYMQFTADRNGIFHDFWSDARGGRTFQIYTSSIKVVEPGAATAKKDAKIKTEQEKEKKEIPGKNKILKQISQFISLEIDPTIYDTTTNILSIPVRVKNISGKPIYGPIKLEITGIDTANQRYTIPTLLNGDNNESVVGAKFNYEINNSGGLLPNSETENIIWKFKVNIPRTIYPVSKEDMKMFNTDKNYRIYWHSYTISHLNVNATGYVAE